jgi:hypothetical protein
MYNVQQKKNERKNVLYICLALFKFEYKYSIYIHTPHIKKTCIEKVLRYLKTLNLYLGILTGERDSNNNTKNCLRAVNYLLNNPKVASLKYIMITELKFKFCFV